MKQTWKSLRSLICSKQQWTKDEDQPICSCCNKSFVRFFRRRHHCRSCGRLFCSNCSDHYINGTYIDPTFQKYLRLCVFCNQKIQSSLRQINICLEEQLPEQLNDSSSESESDSDDSDDSDKQFILPIFQQLASNGSRNEKMLDESIKAKLKVVSMIICGKYELQSMWQQKLSEYAFKAADETIIDSIFSKNTMDILKTVNISTVCCSKFSSTRIFRGYTSQNNIISKQMRSNFTKPKIIIIMGSLQISVSPFSDQKIKFQDLIARQKPMIKKILWKLIKLNPDLIFVEGIVNYTAKEYLQSKGISVVCRVNKEILDNIKKITRIRKTIDKLHKIETYKPEQVVGTCKKLYFQKHQNTELKQKTFMYLQQPDTNIISIVLSHNKQSQLSKLQKAMQQILKIARRLTLQKQIVEIQQSKLIKPSNNFSTTIVSFLDEQISIQKLIAIKECSFSRAKYTPLKLSNFPDIDNMSQIQQYRKNFPSPFKNVLKEKSWQLCNNPTMFVKQFYSDDDISLGGFFLLEVANMNLNCESCGKQKLSHTSLFHYSNRYVKIWLEKQRRPEMYEIEDDNQNKPVNMYISKQLLHIHLKQKFKGQTISSNQKVVTFLECGECCQRFSDEISLSKKYLQNSFQYYLLKLFLSDEIKYQKDIMGNSNMVHNLINISNVEESACSHGKINRVIKSQDVSLKFQTGKLNLYDLSEIDFSLEETKSYLLQQDLSHINHLVSNQFSRIADYIVSITPDEESLRSISNQSLTKRGIKYREIEIKLFDTCVELRKHLIEKKQMFSSNLEVLIKDYTLIQKQLNQIIVYLDLMYKVYLKIQHFHRKDKKEEDELESEDLNMEGSTAKMNGISIMENTGGVGNGKLENLKDYLDGYRRLEWGNKDQTNTFQYAPVFRDNALSIIAHALNSKQYQKVKDLSHQVTIKIQTTQKHYQIQPISTLINPILQQLKIDLKTNNSHHHTVKIMFPKQFQQIRLNHGLDFNLYLKSLIDSHDLHPSGGKSEAEFKRSFNHLFIVKQIKDKQFLEFSEFFLEYYELIKNKSHLSKIFGMYEVDNDKCLIVMQNISFNLDQKSILCYDLKGSDFKRFSNYRDSRQKQFTGKDTNFRLDRNGEPLYLKATTYDSLLSILERDCGFLLKQGVIDYSLLLMIDLEKNLIRLGIIDFMRPFNLIERVQNIYKKIVKGNNPTVVEPKLYENRFFIALKKYFLRSEGCIN